MIKKPKQHWLDKHIGLTIQSRRKAIGKEQKELALEMGLAQPSICRLEKGLTSLKVNQLGKVCSILNLTLVEFFKMVELTEEYSKVLKK